MKNNNDSIESSSVSGSSTDSLEKNINSEDKFNIVKKKKNLLNTDTDSKVFEKLILPKSNSSLDKSIEEIYKKMSHVEHVLEKPDSYVGSTEKEEIELDLLDDEGDKIQIVKKSFEYCPAFYKCFDELIVNAFDHSKRQLKKIESGDNLAIKVSNIKIDINEIENSISIWNDGDGIDIELLPEYNLYPPELIFGTLLTSTNYDDNEQREWGGRNGYGAKLANIYSIKTEIETVDKKREKKYKQTFSNNMSEKTNPIITSFTGKSYTKIVWYPDLKRFNINNLDKNHISLFKKRSYDIAACSYNDVNVFINNKKILEKTFEKYVNLYIRDSRKTIIEEQDGWTVVATDNDNDTFEQRSFVNGINTIRGGKHVDFVVDQIKDKLAQMIKKKRKINVKTAYVKNQLSVFINSTIINPVFDGQTKETLKTNKSKFGHWIELSSKFIEKLYKSDITEKIIAQTNFKENKNLEKTDGKKTSLIRVPKLTDANDAGTRKSKECTLILTEGDSAKSMAIAGLSVIGRSKYGVFPLKGKVLNVRDASNNEILKNAEINNVKKILGLQSNKNYTKEELEKNWPLRYGKIMIMTDQDLDGSHIKGLILNVFDSIWPLLINEGFICSMVTPIIKVKKNKSEKAFYTIQDYEKWKDKNNEGKGWNVKYYKGLGTSTTNEAKDYFKKLHIIDYYRESEILEMNIENSVSEVNDKTNNIENLISNKIDLAFRKDRADDRKEWLRNYDRDDIPDYNKDKMSCNEFIDKELKHFSNYDNDRSLPSVRDGLKPSTRKILYSCFKRNLTNEIKVAQLAGYVSEKAAYHHGEKSLEGSIVGMAQNFVGANNMNLLEPIGQFGTRLLGGKDAAQSRYIYTQLSPLSKIIFNQDDEQLYKYMNDDGVKIEPESYCGILPNILINGGEGIGTGFSCSIPCYNPLDLIEHIKNKLEDKNNKKLKPWYRGFKGCIEEISEGAYISKGCYEKISCSEIKITELPVGTWTEKYIEFLDKITIDKGKENNTHILKGYTDNSSESEVDIILRFCPNTLANILIKPNIDNMKNIEKILKLYSKINTSNMYLFSSNNMIKKYSTVEEIIDEWYNYRHELYVKRKEFLLVKLNKELNIIKYKVMFINEIINQSIDIRNKSKKDVYELLESKNYPQLSLKIDSLDDNKSYDYLLNMNLYKLTKEEIDKLTNERDTKILEVNNLESTSEKKMWTNEMDIYNSIYKNDLKQYNISVNSCSLKKKFNVKR